MPKLLPIDEKNKNDPKYCSIYAGLVMEKMGKMEKVLMLELTKSVKS